MSDFLVKSAWLIPFLPLLGALTAAAGGRWLRQQAHWPVVIGIGLACLVSLAMLTAAKPESTVVVYDWLELGGLHVPIEFRIDGLTTMMLAMVTFVSTLVAVFASGYMAGDPGYPRFFAVVGLFVTSMTGLVLSNNYLLTYVFWEGVGTCSYLLIGFWYYKPSAAAAAKKAFLVNRVGDFGFAIAIFWMWSVVPNHDLSYGNVLECRDAQACCLTRRLWGSRCLLFWAATAKSAQVPLYVWLPDAMEGPTPVSALIHAATMVTAGVYLIARSMPLVVHAPGVQVIIAATGCTTALLSALIALTQTDLKRVLAYSTVSQLGYMFMGLGAGIGGVAQLAVVAAMFHLFTHAFFKALLFLGSGSVMHADGGCHRHAPVPQACGTRCRTPTATFLVGALALSGILPLSGFFSKDEILIALKLASHEAHATGLGWSGLYMAIYWIAVLTACMTAFYTFRAFFLTFWGPEKLPSPDDPEAKEAAATHDDHGDDHGHGHGAHATRPRVAPCHDDTPDGSGGLCHRGGLCVRLRTGFFEHLLGQSLGFEELGHAKHVGEIMTPIVGTLVGLVGIGLAWFLYLQPNPLPGRMAAALGPLYRTSYNKFYVDEFYEWFIIYPVRGLAAVFAFLDEVLVHGLVKSAAWSPRLLGRQVLAPFQNGLIQFYAAVTALGVAALLWIALLSK